MIRALLRRCAKQFLVWLGCRELVPRYFIDTALRWLGLGRD